jgi:hypothetical protein
MTLGYSEEQIEALGLHLNDDGVIACPECGRMLRFNSGDPAVYHAPECSIDGQTYMSSWDDRPMIQIMKTAKT